MILLLTKIVLAYILFCGTIGRVCLNIGLYVNENIELGSLKNISSPSVDISGIYHYGFQPRKPQMANH